MLRSGISSSYYKVYLSSVFLGKFRVELREDVFERVDAEVVNLSTFPAVLTPHVTKLMMCVVRQCVCLLGRWLNLNRPHRDIGLVGCSKFYTVNGSILIIRSYTH